MIPVANRIKAARALAGITVEELAERIDREGLGLGPLKATEQGRRQPDTAELRTIAAACNLREDFFELRVETEVVEAPSVGDRLRAARALGQFSSVEALAAELPAGLGDGTLRAIEQGRRTPTTDELAVIARACKIPPTFFSADFFKAESENPDARRLEEKLDALMAHLGAGAAR